LLTFTAASIGSDVWKEIETPFPKYPFSLHPEHLKGATIPESDCCLMFQTGIKRALIPYFVDSVFAYAFAARIDTKSFLVTMGKPNSFGPLNSANNKLAAVTNSPETPRANSSFILLCPSLAINFKISSNVSCTAYS